MACSLDWSSNWSFWLELAVGCKFDLLSGATVWRFWMQAWGHAPLHTRDNY